MSAIEIWDREDRYEEGYTDGANDCIALIRRHGKDVDPKIRAHLVGLIRKMLKRVARDGGTPQ